MRCFIAVDIPEEIKEHILTVQKELAGLDTKLVEKENIHFTLKFLDELDEGKMKDIMNKLDEIHSDPIKVRLKGIGFFPSQSFIRVVWIGAESHEFLNLHIAVNEALAELIPKEKPVPHLTLARVRSQAFSQLLAEFQDKHKEEFGSFEVKEMKLKSSVVSRNGPVYNDVKTWKL
jgi:RNA 2',3'-cyclic 3'-phosphodiesterase